MILSWLGGEHLQGNGTTDMLYRDHYGPVTDPVVHICDWITGGGDTVRHHVEEWPALHRHVWSVVERYDDLSHLTRDEVQTQVAKWLAKNETRHGHD